MRPEQQRVLDAALYFAHEQSRNRSLVLPLQDLIASVEALSGPPAASGEPADKADLRDGEMVRATTIGQWCTHITNAPGFVHFSETTYERLPGGGS